jgi:hypothetical protein
MADKNEHTHDDGTKHTHANGNIAHEHGKSVKGGCKCKGTREIDCSKHGDKN